MDGVDDGRGDGYYDNAEALLQAGANLYLGRDMFGRTCIDLVEQMTTGRMGIRMTGGETEEEAKAKYRRMLSMLQRYDRMR
mmetsp:Transcript_13292/g.37939  ORF Transcript_13292/g.37939 Transcript_13292/m.37939 type:complete len:81 (+) Transcript_13292:552-794(+)